MTAPQPSNARAALWMSGWLMAMLTMAVAGREAAREISVFQVMELRSIIGFFMLLPLVMAAGGFSAMKTKRPLRHLSRNVVHYGAQYSWLLAVTLIPLGEVVSIEFTMPLWTAILAALFIGESINRWKVAAIVLGLAGVFIIIRPGVTAIEPGHIVSLVAALGFSVSVVLVKTLTRTDSVVRIIFWMLIIQSVIGIIPCLFVWQPVPSDAWGWIVLVAFCGTFSHYCMARAMLYADATIVVPMDFLRVPLTAVAGWLIYSEAMDAYSVLGAALILLGNLLNLKRPAETESKAQSASSS